MGLEGHMSGGGGMRGNQVQLTDKKHRPQKELATSSRLDNDIDDADLEFGLDGGQEPEAKEEELDEYDDGLEHKVVAEEEDGPSTALAREEAALEEKVIEIITMGQLEDLRPNSGQSVVVNGHNICVAFHDEPASPYRAWEWHGHIMMYSDEEGYSAEYVYGNFFEPLDATVIPRIPARVHGTSQFHASSCRGAVPWDQFHEASLENVVSFYRARF
ncbi:hypothetical protein CBR_g20121 [Chara braunii]|uniref:Uncharacterized protein n=1 Tax=Chara braunii TaxID=69332 RepID=A0A388KZK1_CHABU|nr:hypothetical protein CBR_g20121 [Chara braunii]|eukprot:GBG75490.1 hypothetical protein CBR_g20121 [Chara braunii]